MPDIICVIVSSYSSLNMDDKRYDIIDKSMKSLYEVINYSNHIDILNNVLYIPIITIDGKPTEKHIKILNKYPFIKYFTMRYKRLGVANIKNLGICIAKELGSKYIFLADDDVWYSSLSLIEYKLLMKNNEDNLIVATSKKTCNNISPFHKHNDDYGYFIGIHEKIINKIGYFDILPKYFGFEHVHYFYKYLYHNKKYSYYIDVKDNYVNHIGCISSICDDERKSSLKMNKLFLGKNIENINHHGHYLYNK